ncbi:hypothetical protein COX68_00520 [Candidatus Falkowbacteria bacterium CG_4_10_14_0_2_um_filter_41_15]|uniref:PPM-type phosphatase domain-containing protein n=1 Tax=Candidatus Falkowbacteria bacterium CG_4_10_14_0_2_um_filter_41_15 TaxID=1974554 RepID=A0A2M7W080_9BACT|nr:MAG: hypothetical protein COX68_00520 [Candidatus Falkowbacteria bacterium CG_4_10_14_0_2_um_filter_41_15]
MSELSIDSDLEDESSSERQENREYSSNVLIEVDPNESLKVKIEQMIGRFMAIYTKDGANYLGYITVNPCGNKCKGDSGSEECFSDRTYTFVFPCGYEIMLPIPDLDENNLSFPLGAEVFANYLVDEDGNNIDLSLQHVVLCIYSDGTIDVRDLSGAKGKGVSIAFNDLLLSDARVGVDESASRRYDNSSLGLDAEFSGVINGGNPVSAFTARMVGRSKYSKLNEDSIAVNYARGSIVVADGLGGQPHGENASSLAARWIAHSSEPLHLAIWHAHNALDVLNYTASYFERSDTVFVAAKLKGDKVDLAYIGDCRWIIVRGGKIFAKSIPDTFFYNEMMDKKLSAREAFTNELLMKTNHIVNGTLGIQFVTGCDDRLFIQKDVHLLKGDVLILFSDGAANLSDDEIAEVASDNVSLQEMIEQFKFSIRETNNAKFYLRDFKDGGEPVALPSARDNVSIAIYRHEGLE